VFANIIGYPPEVDVKVEMSDLITRLETNSDLIALKSREFKTAQNQIEKPRYKSSFMIFLKVKI